MKQNQNGSFHVLIAVPILMIIIGVVGVYVFKKQSNRPDSNKTTATQQITKTSPTPEPTPIPTPSEPDSADTLGSPTKVPSADGKTYFVYGAPAGQNNKSIKRIIVSLPGHGTTADDGYKAWKQHIENGQYAVAEFNWWRGTGEKTTDYYEPAAVVAQARAFLQQQGYTAKDIVILHGFSRGSANTYAVIAQDRLIAGAVFDAVISNAGKYQSGFPLASPELTDQKMTEVFKNMPWVLACGGLDENPNRDGCPGMEETKTFLTAHQAQVLGTVTDPNEGHGAFHMSSLGLPKQALDLIEAALR